MDSKEYPPVPLLVLWRLNGFDWKRLKADAITEHMPAATKM
jgi:hypothetical protein